MQKTQAAQADDRADRQIDAAGDDEQARAEAEDAGQADPLAEVEVVAAPALRVGGDEDEARRGRARRRRCRAVFSCVGGASGGQVHDRFLGQVGSRELAGELALVHDQDAVAHAEDFFQVAGDHQDGDALLGELVHEGVDFALGADVDAARRLVEDEQRAASGSAIWRGRLSADCRRERWPTICAVLGVRTLKRSHIACASRCLAAGCTMPSRLNVAAIGMLMLCLTLSARIRPSMPAIFGDQEDARRESRRRACECGPAGRRSRSLPAEHAAHAEQRLGQFGAPRAHQARPCRRFRPARWRSRCPDCFAGQRRPRTRDAPAADGAGFAGDGAG